MYNEVNQLYIYMYLFFFKLFYYLGYYRILSSVPCAIYTRSLLVIYFKYSSVYMSIPTGFIRSVDIIGHLLHARYYISIKNTPVSKTKRRSFQLREER